MTGKGRLILVLGLMALPAAPAFSQQELAESGRVSPVRMAVLKESNWDHLAPRGKEADAIYGDVVLRNGVLCAVIAAPLPTRNANMTVREAGGCLIDLTSVSDESDQLSCYYPGQRQFPYRSWRAMGGAREPLAVDGLDYTGLAASLIVVSEASEGRPSVETGYWLTAMQPWLDMFTVLSNPHDEMIAVALSDDLRIDSAREDLFKSPNGTLDLFIAADHFWKQAYGVMSMTDGRRIQATSERATEMRFVTDEGHHTLFIPPGESITLRRRIAPGRTAFHVRANLYLSPNGTMVPVTWTFEDGLGRPIPDVRLELSDSEGQALGVVIGSPEGAVSIPLPAGTYSGGLSVLGQPVQALSGLVVPNAEEERKTIRIDGWRPGTVRARITDEQGQPIPCKVEFAGIEGAPQPSFGPDTAEFGVRNLRYTPDGQFVQPLAPGKYEVVVSHGPEFDAIFTTLEVPAGGDVELAGALVRSVDTTGWISSDFHSHSSPSGDNTSSQLGRVLNLAAEHIEFAPCTEHNRISTYVPHIDQLGLGRFMSSCSGMELTGSPLPLNHQNAFPLVEHPREQDGGGPTTDADIEVQIERLALWDGRSEKLLQQNHPDFGWLFYDRDGDREPDEGFFRSFGFIDVIEVHPLSYVLELGPVWVYDGKTYNHALFNWLQILNQGRVFTGVVNTDAHYNFHGSGTLRNWIASPTDDPAEVQPLDVVRAARERKVIMSTAPFLTLSATAADSEITAGVGEELSAPGGRVRVRIRVQCPNWADVDTVLLLINGRKSDAHRYTREEHPELFGESAVKFDQTLEIELPGDAHLVAIAASSKPLGRHIYGIGASCHANAVTNPIFVDVDGGGFQPNKDPLDAPLPVRNAQ
ncbi:MAG: CehA/McbA family metallohydrolase [Planctomyces sp.]|nr:CehA/McbA family metallohydrolase [Planctomyces sp.]